MVSLILMKKICSMLLYSLFGAVLVRSGKLKVTDTRILSTVVLYLAAPCAILNAFQVDVTPEVVSGLALAFGAALAVHVLFLVICPLLARIFHLSDVEELSLFYPNAGNIIIPIVSSVLGPEWVIYTTGFICVEAVFQWTHLLCRISGENKPDWKKILTNINIIAIAGGLVLFLTGLRLPDVLQDAVSSTGALLGPVSMLIAGMLLAEKSAKELRGYRRLPLIVLLRLIVVPLLILCAVKLSHAALLTPNGETVLLVTMLAVSAPCASTVMQFCVMYGKSPDYAGAINIVSTLCCVASMPVMIALYQLW